MKKIIVHSNYSILNKNSNMLRGVGNVTVKDFLHQMRRLTEIISFKGISLVSSEDASVNSADGYLFVDCPKLDDATYIKAMQSQKPMFLMVWESNLINLNNHNKAAHKNFDIIFTYDDSIIDNLKYFKIAYNFDLNQIKSYQGDVYNRNLLCLISGNNYINRPGELYTQRRKLITWYSENSPNDFHLYGQGWGKIVPPRALLDKFYNKLNFIHPVLSSYNKCYRGEVENKVLTGLNYKFQICFENSSSQVGYISEKLFHALFSESVPIYFGAPNVSDLVPDNCFIDFCQFKNFYELNEFISKMDRDTYQSYLDNAKSFLSSAKSDVFNTEYFSQSVSDIIQQFLESHPVH
jgi:alpha(1,3/1,4) fucosyltransferase